MLVLPFVLGRGLGSFIYKMPESLPCARCLHCSYTSPGQRACHAMVFI